ncbi:MAG: hypothetical protein H5T86_02275, partial [Armatimonadetes bacterium]|nr:hypothetical protein [Armatimonadota bacterium]
MALRGFSLLLLSLAFAAEATRVLAISTLPYYPVHAGDKRVLFCRESVVREQVTERSSVGGYEAFRIVVPAPGRKDVIVVYAAQDAAGTAVVAVEYSRQVLLLDPPFLIPAEVTEGQRITLAGTIRHPLLGPVGTYDGLLIVESISETAATQAGT